MSEFVEYNCDTNPYPSFGKKYNDEKAIISLTSWRARINTVSKTIYSLLKQCPGFHIVLVLSEEEFPKMMDELPENLKLFVDNEMIEILWVYKNYKAFKKVLFTMDKYRDVPVISADDDCIYTCNYAQELYDKWTTDKNSIWSYHLCRVCHFQHGPTTIYPPFCFSNNGITKLSNDIMKTNHDDVYYGCMAEHLSIKIKEVSSKICYYFHDTIEALSERKLTWNTKKAIDFIKKRICQK